MSRRTVGLIALLAALALVAGACGDDGGTSDGAKKTVKIGFIGDLTGSNSALVVPGRDAAALAFEQANASGDLKVNIEFVPLDNKEADPSKAPPLAQQLVADAAVVGVIGPAFSGETSAVQPIFKGAGLTHITQSATRADLTTKSFSTFFRSVGGDTDQAEAAARLGVKNKNCKRLAIIDDKSAYGQGYADIANTKAKAYGATVVTRQSVAPTTDYTSLVDTLTSSNPDCVIYGGYQPQTSILVKQMRQKGVKALLISGDGSKSTKLIPDAGAANAEGMLLTCPCLDANVSDAADAKKFVADFKKKYNNTAPDIYAPEAYDVANIFVNAIKGCGSDVTRACVLKGVTELKDFKGLTKTFNWTTEANLLHEVTDKGVNIYEVKGGKILLVDNINNIVPA